MRRLKRGYADKRLTFAGPATNGSGTKPGEYYFSLHGRQGITFVTAVPRAGLFAVRSELTMLR